MTILSLRESTSQSVSMQLGMTGYKSTEVIRNASNESYIIA